MTPLGVHVVIVRFGKVLQVGIVIYDLFAKSRVLSVRDLSRHNAMDVEVVK